MRGSITQRSKGSWTLIVNLGYQMDPTTGLKRRKQHWQTIRGTRREAETALTNLLKSLDSGTHVDASTITLGQWLDEWLEAGKPHWAATTYVKYENTIRLHLKPAAIGNMRLQEIRATH